MSAPLAMANQGTEQTFTFEELAPLREVIARSLVERLLEEADGSQGDASGERHGPVPA